MFVKSFLGTILFLAIAAEATDEASGEISSQEVAYNFRYSVDSPSSGVAMDQWEQRDGNHVMGAYSMLEADGSIRRVYYVVDGRKGFKADVKREWRRMPKMGHLAFPKDFREPIRHAKPISLITKEFLSRKNVQPYPNVPLDTRHVH